MYYDKICISKYIWNKFKFEISGWNFEICTKIEISYTIFECDWPLGKFTRDSVHPQDQLVTVKQRNGDYASFSELSNILQNVLSKKIAS